MRNLIFAIFVFSLMICAERCEAQLYTQPTLEPNQTLSKLAGKVLGAYGWYIVVRRCNEVKQVYLHDDERSRAELALKSFVEKAQSMEQIDTDALWQQALRQTRSLLAYDQFAVRQVLMLTPPVPAYSNKKLN
jgi:hypothetical protein